LSPHATRSLLRSALLAAAACCAGCGSSTTTVGTSDAGDGSSSSYGPQPDGSAEGAGGEGGGDGGGDAGVCRVPPGAETMTQTEAGVVGCSAVTSNTLCDPQLRLICRAPDPAIGVPMPPSSLSCTLQPNNGDPAVQYWCCPCQ
jgi:hypothetical protein